MCTLVVGLFIGGAGAVAVADSETGGSSTPSQGTTGTNGGQQSPNKLTAGFGVASKVTTAITAGVVKVGSAPIAEDDAAAIDTSEDVDGLDSSLTDLAEGGEDDAVAAASDVDETETTVEAPGASEVSEVTPLPAADLNVTTPETTTTAAASTTPASASPEAATPISATPKPGSRSGLDGFLTDVTPPQGGPYTYSTYRSEQFFKAIEPITNAFTTVVQVMGTVPYTLAALPTSKTPIRDVITSVQYMLTTVADAMVPIVYVPRNLYTLMVTVPPVELPVFAGPITSERPTPVPAPESPLFGPQASPVPYSAPADAPLFGTMTPRAALGAAVSSGLNTPLSVAGTVPAAPETVKSSDAKSFLDHVVSAVLVPASLTALAALALPGVAGLLIIVAAGIRLGYRQAKAAFVMRASGIARFAGSGPVGVVRSGSFITLRQRARGPRTKRAVCPQSAGVVRTLEEVA